MPLGSRRNSSESGNVLRHHCCPLAERSRLQAEFCKPLWAATGPGCAALANPEKVQFGAGQPKSSRLPKRRLLANPGALSISVQTRLAVWGDGLRAGRCQGYSWCFDTRFPKLCRGSLASRRAFSALCSSHHVCGQAPVFCLDNAASGLGEL